jgi:hypothetical protein
MVYAEEQLSPAGGMIRKIRLVETGDKFHHLTFPIGNKIQSFLAKEPTAK